MSDTIEEEKNKTNRLPGLYGNTDLSSRISQFQGRADQHKEKQKLNPFSGSFDAVAAAKQKLNKEDANYGKPVEGSKTEQRGKQAAQLLFNEIKLLCEIITKHGVTSDDGKHTMKFKELFELYKVISNKVVGLLLRARKYSLVDFEGEMLYQGRDDSVVITLLRSQLNEKDFEELAKSKE
ncbi:actin-binding Rho-activating protein-like [Oppia nitens]|uniref:actin-binding Rho-activating protein-like n=1 Tax=Oppia nitens TaxID=1686743 RepID=UPI0023DC47BC|nr:actin-binding Rho-activating protein-like [Oppia nitens]